MIDKQFLKNIESMKRQMVPSDETVSLLLNKISAMEASSAPLDNGIPFNPVSQVPAVESAQPAAAEKHAKSTGKGSKRTFFYYSTAAVAALILLTSTLLLFNDSKGKDSAGDLFESVTGQDIASVSGDVDIITYSADGEDDETVTSDDKKDDKNSDTAADSKDDKGGKDTKDAKDNKDNKDISDKKDGNKDTDDKKPADVKDGPKDTKVTPGASGTEDIHWDRDILAADAVSNLEVSGNNYVTPTVAPRAITTTEVATISLALEETATTRSATVDATVKKLKNVSSDMLVAVQVDGFSDTLLYFNEDYHPDSLSAFLSDSGLSNSAKYDRSVMVKGEKIGFSSYKKLKISNLSKLIKKHLFSGGSCSLADYGSYESGTAFAIFKSPSNPTGFKMDFGVSNSGYLHIKISNGKAFTFNIGKEAAESFIEAVAAQNENKE